MPSCYQISLAGQPASASFRMATICVSVNFDWRMGISWLGGRIVQNVLLTECRGLREAYDQINN